MSAAEALYRQVSGHFCPGRGSDGQPLDECQCLVSHLDVK
jgi:hypothetical protein